MSLLWSGPDKSRPISRRSAFVLLAVLAVVCALAGLAVWGAGL